MNKLILNFKSKDSKKIKDPKNFLGGKGANLSEMGRMGLPVPPGFTISTKVCEIFYKDNVISNGKVSLNISSNHDVSLKLKSGVESLFYMSKVPVPILEIECSTGCSINTNVSFAA